MQISGIQVKLTEGKFESDDAIEIEGNRLEVNDGYINKAIEWFNGEESYLSKTG